MYYNKYDKTTLSGIFDRGFKVYVIRKLRLIISRFKTEFLSYRYFICNIRTNFLT